MLCPHNCRFCIRGPHLVRIIDKIGVDEPSVDFLDFGSHKIGGAVRSVFISICISFLCRSPAFGGELSELDIVVREAVERLVAVDREGRRLPFDLQEDVWSLSLTNNDWPKTCLAMVHGFARAVNMKHKPTIEFWACVRNDSFGGYEAEVYDYQIEE